MNGLLRTATTAVLYLTILVAHASPLHPTDSLVIRFANRTRLVIYAPDKAGIQALSNYDLNKIVREMGMKLDSVPGGQTAIIQDGNRFLKDTVLVVTKKKNGVTIVINGSDTTRTDAGGTRDYKEARQRNRDRNNWNFDYSISVGLNNVIQQSTLPAYPEGSYDLRAFGSRYIAFTAGAMPTLIRGNRASLKLYYGLEVAWNNFMFDSNNIIEKTPNGVVFQDAGRSLQKTKLTVCTVGLPIVPRVTFYDSRGRKSGHIGLGAYINYRLDSYRKLKEADGSKNRQHSNFDLNDYRYGLMAHFGVRGANFFVKYDLSPLFKAGLGPDVRALSFGIGF